MTAKTGTSASPTPPAVVAAWIDVAERRDAEGIAPLLADDVVFQSPAVFKPQAGKAITVKYLQAALAVLNNESFRYENMWFAERSAVLEFALVLDGIHVNGVDIIFWNERGLITEFRVMVRPLKGLNTVIPHMAARLQAE